uniref:Uncharacterized protein n=1 Tax=Ditylenchus dipsaci TaxID=166011 RepID=A0A915EHP7_9BILA
MQTLIESTNQRLIESQSNNKALILQHQEEKMNWWSSSREKSFNNQIANDVHTWKLRTSGFGTNNKEEKHRSVEIERKLMEYKQEERLTQEKFHLLSQQNEDKEIYCADLEKELNESRQLFTISSQLHQTRQQAQSDLEKWQQKLESLEKFMQVQADNIHDMAIKIEIAEEQKNALQKELEDNEEEFSRNLKLITQLTNEKAATERKLAVSLAEGESLKHAFRDEQLEKKNLTEKWWSMNNGCAQVMKRKRRDFLLSATKHSIEGNDFGISTAQRYWHCSWI